MSTTVGSLQVPPKSRMRKEESRYRPRLSPEDEMRLAYTRANQRAMALVSWHNERLSLVDKRVPHQGFKPADISRVPVRVFPNSIFDLVVSHPNSDDLTTTLRFAVEEWQVMRDHPNHVTGFTAVPCHVGEDVMTVPGDHIQFCLNAVTNNWALCDRRFQGTRYTFDWLQKL